MKRFLMILVALMATVTLGFAQASPKEVAVSTFDVMGNVVSKDEAEFITELYIGRLVDFGKMYIFDRKNFDKILDEMKFQGGDWASSEKTIELGKATGASVLGRGRIFKLGSSFYISATMIDAKSAEIISSSQKPFKTIDDIPNLLVSMAKEISEKINVTETKTYNIGDIGPGGGTVYLKTDVGEIFEFKEVGSGSWETAKNLCKNGNYGNHSDWYLSSKSDLLKIYEWTSKISPNSKGYWSSSFNSEDGRPIMVDFKDGSAYYVKNNETSYSVLAIRSSVFSTKKKVAVSTFEMKGDAFTQEEAEAITELYIGDIASTGKVSIFDRKSFDKILAEMKFQAGDWGASEKTVKLNQATGASVLGRGQIFKLGSTYYISTTMIDANTARILSSEQKSFTSIDELPSLLNPIALGITQKISQGIINYAVGEKGLAGGTVFKIDGNMRYEISGNLGQFNYENAADLFQANSNPYYDWELPTIDEMKEVYNNLAETKLFGDLYEFRTKGSYAFDLKNGSTRKVEDSAKLNVCLVRKFNINDKTVQTAPQSPVGVYTAQATVNEVCDKFKSYFGSADKDKWYLNMSKYGHGNRKLNFTLYINEDGTFKVVWDSFYYKEYYEDKGFLITHRELSDISYFPYTQTDFGYWRMRQEKTINGNKYIIVYSSKQDGPYSKNFNSGCYYFGSHVEFSLDSELKVEWDAILHSTKSSEFINCNKIRKTLNKKNTSN